MKVNNIFSYIKEKATVIVISVIVITGILLVSKVYLEDRIPDHTTYLGHADEEQFIYNLTDDDVIIQEFASPYDFDYATIHFSNHEQRIEGKTYIKVEKVYDNTLITYLELDNPSITYDEYVKLDFGGGGIKDEQYRITISFEGMGEQGLGIMGYEYPGSFLPPCNLSLLYAVAVGTHSTTYKFQLFAKIVVFYLCLVVLWGIYVYEKENWKSEQRFLAVAIPMGAFFLLFPAINPVYDGTHHLDTSYHYSNYLFFDAVDDPNGDILALQKDEADLFGFGYEEPHDFHVDHKMLNDAYIIGKEFHLFTNDKTWALAKDRKMTYDSSPFEYFPAIIGLTIGRWMRLGGYAELLFAKTIMMLGYLYICYAAIRLAPCKKELLSFVGMSPMILYSAAGITYDSIVVAGCIMLTAIYLLGRIKVLNWKHVIIIGLCCFILGVNKGGVYLLLPLVFFSIPKEIQGVPTKRYRVWVSGIFCGFLGVLPTVINVYIKFIKNAFQTDISSIKGYIDVASVNTSSELIYYMRLYRLQNGELLSLKDLVLNPFASTKMILLTLLDQADDMLGQMLGNRVAFASSNTNWIITLVFLFIIVLSAIQNEDRDCFIIDLRTKLLIGFLLLLQMLSLCLIMMVTETGKNDYFINGVQGRYFIPWMALLFLLLSNNHVFVKKRMIYFESYIYLTCYCCYGTSYLCHFIMG